MQAEHASNPPQIEPAKTSRGKCGQCQKNIIKDTLRLGIFYPLSRDDPDPKMAVKYYHLQCVSKRQREKLPAADDIGGWEDLKPEDRTIAEKWYRGEDIGPIETIQEPIDDGPRLWSCHGCKASFGKATPYTLSLVLCTKKCNCKKCPVKQEDLEPKTTDHIAITCKRQVCRYKPMPMLHAAIDYLWAVNDDTDHGTCEKCGVPFTADWGLKVVGAREVALCFVCCHQRLH
jgi:hypothetical protein